MDKTEGPETKLETKINQQLIVRREDPTRCDLLSSGRPSPRPGEVLVSIEKFGLTSNNITYVALRGSLPYLEFFPPLDPERAAEWGCPPVWGMARIIESNHADLHPGLRVFGFFPAAVFATLAPAGPTLTGFRVERPGIPPQFGLYNLYHRTDRDPFYTTGREDSMVVFRPLLLTGLLLADYLAAHDFMGAEAVILSSASSKTSWGLAAALRDAKRCAVVGLASSANKPFAEAMGVYDRVIAYDEIASLDATTTATYVDVAGNLAARERLATHLGSGLKQILSVGMTHRQPGGYGATPTGTGAPAQVFFAPGWMVRRAKELGDGFQRSLLDGWHALIATAERHFRVVHRSGGVTIAETFAELGRGRARPDEAYVLCW